MTHSLSRQLSTARLSAYDISDDDPEAAFVLAGTSADPFTLLLNAKHAPIQTALGCQRGLEILERGGQKQRRLFIGVGYKSGFYISQNDDLLIEFDRLLVDQGILKRSDLEETRERLIYRMMDLIFHKAGLTTSNTAYRYGHGLFHFFSSRMCPEKMLNIIVERGPEQLYKDEVKRRQTDRAIANSLHARHVERLMRDGRYALEILGIDATNASEAAVDESEINGGVATEADTAGDDEPILDDDDNEVAPPSWRSQEIAKRFDKMLTIATQLNAEIVESKAVLEDDPNDDEYENMLLRFDENIPHNDAWKTKAIEMRYEDLLKRAVRLNANLLELKHLLEEHVK